jgi:hypothetical protein
MSKWLDLYNYAQRSYEYLNQDAIEDQAVRRKTPAELRAEFLADVWKRGGQGFLERAKKYGRTESGEEIRWRPWFEETCLLVGDFRVAHVLTTGAAQIAKTFVNTLCAVDSLYSGRVNTVWFYDKLNSLLRNSRNQFHPVASTWETLMYYDGIEVVRPGKGNVTQYPVEGAYMMFSYASTGDSGSTGAAVGSAAASFQGDVLWLEERSQYPLGAADPLPRRLDASKIASRPIRELGTQGSGGGIESVIKDSDYHFFPHVTCPKCGHLQALDPKGCLLRPATIRDALGRDIVSYFSASNRPLNWFCHDQSNRIDTAYIGCQKCEAELPQKTRAWESHMRCLKTQKSLAEFLGSLTEGLQQKRWRCTIHLSPLLRETEFNLAAELIRSGIEIFNPTDWIQQALGHTSEASKAAITTDMIKEAIAQPMPHRKPDYTLAGIDQGRGEDWITIVDYYLPDDHQRLLTNQAIEQTVRHVRYCAAIQRSDVKALLESFGCVYGIMDNEPSRETAIEMSESTCLDLGDQIYKPINNNVENKIIYDGGRRGECWKLDTNYFANNILNAFILNKVKLNEDWEKWLTDRTAMSPVKHFTGVWRDTKGVWQRASDSIDDLFMAFVFAETSFYVLMNKLRNPKRASPDAAYNYFNYDLHIVRADELSYFKVTSSSQLMVSINWLSLTAITATYQDKALIVLGEHKAENHGALCQWVKSQAKGSKLLIYGIPTHEHVLGWLDFWVYCRKNNVRASQCYSSELPMVESVSCVNRAFRDTRLWVMDNTPKLTAELERSTIWEFTGKLGGKFEFSDCLRAIAWQVIGVNPASPIKITTGSKPI